MQTTPPQDYNYPPVPGSYENGERTGTPRLDNPSSPQQGVNGAGSAMSLNALIDGPPPRAPPNADDGRDIDKSMLGRLNRRT